MGERLDYYDDPAAPPVNSVQPSAAAYVVRDGAVLLTCRTDNGNWTMPGGAHDLGESLSQTAVRETLEETGITVRLTGVAGIYTDPRHVIHYTSNNEVRQEFTVVYRAEYVRGNRPPAPRRAPLRGFPRGNRRAADGPQPTHAARLGCRPDRHLDCLTLA